MFESRITIFIRICRNEDIKPFHIIYLAGNSVSIRDYNITDLRLFSVGVEMCLILISIKKRPFQRVQCVWLLGPVVRHPSALSTQTSGVSTVNSFVQRLSSTRMHELQQQVKDVQEENHRSPACVCVRVFLLFSLWPPYVIWQAIIFLPCSFCLSSSFFPGLISAAAGWMSTIL